MATLTITTTSAEDSRLAAAFGKELNLSGNASAAQIKAAVIAYIKGVVLAQESRTASANAVAAVTTISPS